VLSVAPQLRHPTPAFEQGYGLASSPLRTRHDESVRMNGGRTRERRKKQIRTLPAFPVAEPLRPALRWRDIAAHAPSLYNLRHARYPSGSESPIS